MAQINEPGDGSDPIKAAEAHNELMRLRRENRSNKSLLIPSTSYHVALAQSFPPRAETC